MALPGLEAAADADCEADEEGHEGLWAWSAYRMLARSSW
jgi:hypothetical protein